MKFKTENNVIIKQDDNGDLELEDARSEIIMKDLEKGRSIGINSKTGNIFVIDNTSKRNNGEYDVGTKKYMLHQALKTYLEGAITPQLQVDMVLYMDSTMELLEAGFTITNDNREDVYIEILETDNEDLISLLENYLILKDNITTLKFNRGLYNKTIDDLKLIDEESTKFKDLYEKFV